MPDRREPSAPEKAAGQILKTIRQEKGLAATAVAYRLGMSERNLLRYEDGRNQLNVLQIGDFAWALEEDPRALFERLYPLLRSENKAPGAPQREPARFSPRRAAEKILRMTEDALVTHASGVNYFLPNAS